MLVTALKKSTNFTIDYIFIFILSAFKCINTDLKSNNLFIDTS